MRILVTGCAGFIGFNLTLKLLEKFSNSKIFGIDNFDNYYSIKLKRDRKKRQQRIKDILGGVRSSCTYVGAPSLKQLSKCTTFVRVTKQFNDTFVK